MEININYALAYYTTNVNVYEFHWKSYGHALWYDTREENYGQAKQRIKEVIWEEIFKENPHLAGMEVRFIESGEMPILQEKER